MATRRPARALAALFAALLVVACDSKSPGPFHRVDGVWHYGDTPIRAADGATFKPLDDHYAKDARQVYYARTTRDASEYYAIRHSRVDVIEGADPASFASMGYGYARDARAAWFEGQPFPVRDVASLTVIDSAFTRDRVRGYYHQVEVPGSDGATFAMLDDRYAKDAKQVYYGHVEPAPRAPKIHIAPIAGADPATFVPLEDRYAKDGKRVYHEGRPLAAIDDLRTLGFDYAVNGTTVYFRGTPIQGADAATFRLTPEAIAKGVDAQDARALYRSGAIVPR
jgi:hypothetical protein